MILLKTLFFLLIVLGVVVSVVVNAEESEATEDSEENRALKANQVPGVLWDHRSVILHTCPFVHVLLLQHSLSQINSCHFSYGRFTHIKEANGSFSIVLTNQSRLHVAINKRSFTYKLNCDNSY